jgi:hypothetical protein
MNWLDLYTFLHERANDIQNPGSFPWQEKVQAFDFGTLEYYPIDFIQTLPDQKISFNIDTSEIGEDNGS